MCYRRIWYRTLFILLITCQVFRGTNDNLKHLIRFVICSFSYLGRILTEHFMFYDKKWVENVFLRRFRNGKSYRRFSITVSRIVSVLRWISLLISVEYCTIKVTTCVNDWSGGSKALQCYSTAPIRFTLKVVKDLTQVLAFMIHISFKLWLKFLNH